MNETNYFSRSWSLLTRDKGWIKPVLVMTVADLVPIVGSIGNQGYVLEWARLTAWGVDAAPKQKDVNIGDCLMSGLRAFVVALGWGAVFYLVTQLIPLLAFVLPRPLDTIFGLLFSMVTLVVSLFYAATLSVAQIRTSIYENIGAGYRVDRIFEMIKRDFKGFLMLILINLVCGFVVAIIIGLAIGIGFAFFMPFIVMASRESSVSSQEVIRMITAMIIPLSVFLVIFLLVYGFVGNIVKMITTTAAALWMRQFDVPSWGKSSDPLPEPTTGGFSSYASHGGPMPQQSPEPYEQNVQPQAPVQLPESAPQPAPTPAPAPVLDPEPKPDPEPEPEPEPAPEPPQQPEVAPEAEPAPSPDPTDEEVADDGVKDVDALYADLYDVIQRNNHAEDDK